MLVLSSPIDIWKLAGRERRVLLPHRGKTRQQHRTNCYLEENAVAEVAAELVVETD